MDLILIVQVIIWAVGGWITGLVIKASGIKLSGGYLFLMLVGWAIAGVLGLIGFIGLSDGMLYEEPIYVVFYGAIIGVVGGFFTIRQLAKARKKRST